MRDNLGRFIKGHKQSNTGRTWIKSGEKRRLGSKHTEESKKMMSISHKGIIPVNIEFIKTYKRPRGKDSPLWKGGVDESAMWRGRIEWKAWRTAVFERDNYICQKCLIKSGRLHPHHIKTFKDNVDYRFDIDNGITLCIPCHRLFHKRYGRTKIGKKEIDEFIQNN